jgi:hypothetical protein
VQKLAQYKSVNQSKIPIIMLFNSSRNIFLTGKSRIHGNILNYFVKQKILKTTNPLGQWHKFVQIWPIFQLLLTSNLMFLSSIIAHLFSLQPSKTTAKMILHTINIVHPGKLRKHFKFTGIVENKLIYDIYL